MSAHWSTIRGFAGLWKIRGTRCSEACAALLLSVSLATSGCVTGSELRRGGLVDRTPASESHDDKFSLEVHAANTAVVRVARKTCTTYDLDYQQTKIEHVDYPATDPILYAGVFVVSLVAFGWGGLYLLEREEAGEDLDFDNLEHIAAFLATVVGGAALVGSTIVLFSTVVDGDFTTTETREVPTAELARDTERKCADSTFVQASALPYRLSVGREQRTGSTGPSGQLPVTPLVLELLMARTLSDGELRQVISGEGIRYNLELGPASAGGLLLPDRDVPDSIYRELAARYESKLTGDERVRWENCRLISRSEREGLQCYLSQ